MAPPHPYYHEDETNDLAAAPSANSPLHTNLLGTPDQSINSLKVLEEGAIDELLSLGSAPLSPNLGSLSPDSWRLTNPVHMELQENAKLPTFTWAVDRTGSVEPKIQRPRYLYQPTASQASPNEPHEHHAETKKAAATTTTDQDTNWTELFLNNNRRKSFSANYQQAGVLRQDTTKQIVMEPLPRSRSESGTLEQQAESELDALKALGVDVDPTPLSEIKRRAQNYLEARMQHADRQVPLPIPSGPKTTTNATAESATTTNTTASIADAVATAAAIAAQQAQDKDKKATAVTTGGTGSRSLSSSIRLAVTAGRPRPTFTVPQNATKHAISSMAVQDAAKRHAQYGFGAKHVVPSVPAPPTGPSMKRAKKTNNASGRKGSTETAPWPLTPKPPTIVPGDNGIDNDKNSTTTHAYERKKQRAKDARIKLNESIDRLSIAMSLAGTQSKQRMQQWQHLPMGNNSGIHRPAGLQIMKDCVRTAESAKKWDRPSFVGTAATLIQGLNAQCESLMREVLALHEANKAGLHLPIEGEVQNGNHHNPGIPKSISVPVNSVKRPSSLTCAVVPAQPESNKRQRVNGQEEGSPSDSHMVSAMNNAESSDGGIVVGSVVLQRKVIERIASFLDPKSLVRCHGVSRAWKEAMTLANEKVWQDVAIARFGFYNVRQWQGKLDGDEEEGISATGLALYKNMDEANVIPHFHHDGMFLLGEARLPGKVSAWTYLVQRSNGETLRSVRREPTMQGSGIYLSLPVVELRTVVQNTGVSDQDLILRKQTQTVDASTRRRGEEMREIDWDDRFKKRVLNLDGSPRPTAFTTGLSISEDLCRLRLFEGVIIVSYIFAKGCSTTSKFVQRSNFTKVLVQISSGTVPLVIPFPRDATGLQH